MTAATPTETTDTTESAPAMTQSTPIHETATTVAPVAEAPVEIVESELSPALTGDGGDARDDGAPAQHGLTAHSHGPVAATGAGGRPRTGAQALSRAGWPTSHRVEDHVVPRGREEAWRFTPLTRLAPLFEPAGADAVRLDVVVALVDGVSHRRGDVGESPAFRPGDRSAAVAWADTAATGGADVVTIAAEAQIAEPVTVALRAVGPRSVGHLVVEAGPYSRATVVIDHTGGEAGGAVANGVELRVGEGAHLTVVSVQQWADDVVHLAQHDAGVGRDATLKHAAVSLTGALVRMSATVRYEGPGGDAELLGVYFADAGQHLEHRSFIDHQVPNCRSNVVYKGALQGATAHTVWVGDVLIGQGALNTDTYELNRNLVLTDGARADSVPNLEIETGEIVGAGHASATGRFDDEQLFYLTSRGIPTEVARRMVVRAFFYEVLQKIGVPEVTERLAAAIDAELEHGALPAVAPVPVGV